MPSLVIPLFADPKPPPPPTPPPPVAKQQQGGNPWRALGVSRRSRGVLEGVINLAHRRAGGKQSYGAFRQWFVHEAPATALPLSEAEAWRCHGLAADPQLQGIVRKVFDVCMPQDRAASTALFRTMHAVLGPTSARPAGAATEPEGAWNQSRGSRILDDGMGNVSLEETGEV